MDGDIFARGAGERRDVIGTRAKKPVLMTFDGRRSFRPAGLFRPRRSNPHIALLDTTDQRLRIELLNAGWNVEGLR
jgi:hypothetical protein